MNGASGRTSSFIIPYARTITEHCKMYGYSLERISMMINQEQGHNKAYCIVLYRPQNPPDPRLPLPDAYCVVGYYGAVGAQKLNVAPKYKGDIYAKGDRAYRAMIQEKTGPVKGYSLNDETTDLIQISVNSALGKEHVENKTVQRCMALVDSLLANMQL